jgi:hypothetical protein
MEPAGSGGTWTGSPKGVFAGRKHHKPRQGVVASSLKSHRKGAVGFIDWLDFGAWFVNQTIIKRAVALAGLTSANGTALDITAEDVDLSFCDAAVVTVFAAICTPVFLLLSIADAIVNFSQYETSWVSLFLSHGCKSNENKMSDVHRERAWAAVNGYKPRKTRTRGGWPFAPSPG